MYAVAESSAHLEQWGKKVFTVDVCKFANFRDDTAVEDKLKKLIRWAVSDLLDNICEDRASGRDILPILEEYRAS